MFYFDLQEHIEGISYLFRPMKVQLKEHFTHEIHGDLVSTVGVEELKEVVDHYKQLVYWVVVLALEDYSHYLEEVVLVEGWR